MTDTVRYEVRDHPDRLCIGRAVRAISGFVERALALRFKPRCTTDAVGGAMFQATSRRGSPA